MKFPPRVLSVIGTRPDAIKMAPLIRLLNLHLGDHHKVCNTGQHDELVDGVLLFFDIHPDYHLNLMTGRQDVIAVVGKIIFAIAPVLDDFKPDWVLVHGDTATCLGATLVAFYRKIRIGHVEAGLRSGSLSEPFPEESIRILTDQLAEACFVPTDLCRNHLLQSGKPEKNIIHTGNTGIDSLLLALERAQELSEHVSSEIRELLKSDDRLILLTIHRRENQGDHLLSVCEAIRQITSRHKDARVLLPLHPNPAVKDCLVKELAHVPGVVLSPPLDYPDFILVMQRCFMVLTDSGGIQEEAPVLGKPVLVLRNLTERQEMVISGNVKITGTSTDAIVEAVSGIWDDDIAYLNMVQPAGVYGDGSASAKILEFILNN